MNTDFISSEMTKNQHPSEGPMTKAIEKQTAKIPSVAFLGLAAGSIAISLGLAMTTKRKGLANFVGLWVPSLLLLGIYNKIVKAEGSDLNEKSQNILH
jgi:hypothetical protein